MASKCGRHHMTEVHLTELSVARADLAASRAREAALREALEEIEQASLIQGRRIGIWMCPRCGVESTMRLAIHHTDDCPFFILAAATASQGDASQSGEGM